MELISEAETCTRCRDRSFSFDSNFSLFAYDEAMKKLIGVFKGNNVKALGRFFAEKIAPVVINRYRGFVVSPVPFRKKRKRHRGWDQIEVICRNLQQLGSIEVSYLLKRRGSKAQKSLNYLERMENLRGKIYLRGGMRSVPGKVILLDDVFTTGATADACALALRSIGVAEIRLITLAID